MLTPQDDLLGHQLPTTFDHVVSSDERWTERYWYTGHPPDGSMILDCGLGWYPNRNVMDAFAGVTIDGSQYNFRASRHLRPSPLAATVGPLSFQVLEGMKRHRIVLKPNDSPLSFDLQYEAAFPPLEEAQSYRRIKGRVAEDLTRMAQFGRWSGWIELNGRKHELTADKWWGQRDHSWGVRWAMHTDATRAPVAKIERLFWCWCAFQFEDFCINFFLKERSPEKTMYLSGVELRRDGTRREVERVEHDITWADDPHGQTWTRARLTLHFVGGATRVLDVEQLPARFYLKGGMYGGYNGWCHGDDRGPLYTAHDIWDLNDHETRAASRTLSDHVSRIESEGLVGYGISEYGVASGYPKYLEPQAFPSL